MSRLLRTSHVGLFGEPLAGLQVMGLLEARGLDSRHIILLGAQEGKLPTASIERSYIPFELRRAYGLPLRDSSDAVQAYNFLRLLQRTEVVLVYAEDGSSNRPAGTSPNCAMNCTARSRTASRSPTRVCPYLRAGSGNDRSER